MPDLGRDGGEGGGWVLYLPDLVREAEGGRPLPTLTLKTLPSHRTTYVVGNENDMDRCTCTDRSKIMVLLFERNDGALN